MYFIPLNESRLVLLSLTPNSTSHLFTSLYTVLPPDITLSLSHLYFNVLSNWSHAVVQGQTYLFQYSLAVVFVKYTQLRLFFIYVVLLQLTLHKAVLWQPIFSFNSIYKFCYWRLQPSKHFGSGRNESKRCHSPLVILCPVLCSSRFSYSNI